MTFKERLRKLRGELSQREVAERCGMPQTTYSALENQENPPKMDVLEKLASGFGIHVQYFTDEQPRLTPGDRVGFLNYVQGLRNNGHLYKTAGIGHTQILDPKEEAEQIRRILAKRQAASSDD